MRCSIIVLIILTFKSGICDRCNTWTKEIPTEATYHCNEESTNTCSENIANFTILGTNKEEGTVDVGFAYESNCQYNLELKQWPKINNETCTNGLSAYDAIYHSQYTYSGVSDKSVQSCTKKGIIKLKYVNTGCYSIKLTKRKLPNVYVNSEVLPSQFFSFPARKLNFLDFRSTSKGVPQFRDKDLLLNVWHPFLKQHPNLKLIIKNKYNNCTNPRCGYFKFSPSSDNAGEVKYNLCTNNKKNDTDIGVSCSVTYNHLSCVVEDLDDGEYSIEYIFKNLIQCPNKLPSVFVSCGERGTIINYPPKTAAVEVPPPKYDEIMFILAGVGCVVVLILAITFYRIKSNGKLKETLQRLIYPEKKPTVGQSKVLLLYAKDADIVMETMKSFRTALIAKGLEVYDVYDPDQQKLIDEYQEKWITAKLSDKYMKIIIVETYCGQFLLKSSLPAEKLYKNSTCYDRYFPYAISLIRGTIYANDYTKLFVANIGFDFEKTDCSEFMFLSTSKRFGLPQNFIKLKEELYHDNEEYVIDIYQSEKELEEFKCVHEQMKDYIADPNYLSKVLKISISHLNNKFDIEEIFKKEIIE